MGFCREWLCCEPYGYMHGFLRGRSHLFAVVAARQTGETFNGVAKLLYFAFRYPGSLTLVTAPKCDQVKNIAFKAFRMHLRRLENLGPGFYDCAVGKRNMLRTVIRLRSGSQILAESPVPEIIRGHTEKAVY